MRDQGDQDRIKSIKQQEKQAKKAALDTATLEKLDELAMHESLYADEFKITAVLAGWLYTIFDKNGEPVDTTFVGDDR